MKKIDLLRHGRPEGGEVFRGATDHPLTPEGWSQMKQACQDKKWDLIVTSPMKRCQEFAENLVELCKVDMLIADDFREFNFGRWENQPTEKVFKEDYEHLKGMWSDPMNFVAPDGEALIDFEARVLKAWFGCLARKEENILVVCHGGVIRILLKEVLGLPFQNINRIDVPYASMSRITATLEEPYTYQLTAHG